MAVTTDPDRAARFAGLMAEFERPMRRLCGAYSGGGADGEDLFQKIVTFAGRTAAVLDRQKRQLRDALADL